VKFLHHFVTNTSGNCLQKIGILDRSLIKLLQNEQGCNFFCLTVHSGVFEVSGPNGTISG